VTSTTDRTPVTSTTDRTDTTGRADRTDRADRADRADSDGDGDGENNVVRVSVNGQSHEIAADTSLDALVATLTRAPSGVAAALNETVVPRTRWSVTVLGDGDRVEVLTAVQGG
jgi:sulfur carrier protein